MAYIAGNQVAAAKAAGFKIDVIPSEVVNELDIQTTTAPFNNPDVVKAINYAINRQAILQVQAAGYGAISYQPFPKGFVGYSAKLANLYPYNPRSARQLLAQAGYPNGLKITLSTVSTTTRSPSRSRASSRRSASPPPSTTSRRTPRPSSSTSTRPSRSRSTGRPGGCRRWRCSTSCTASRA